MSDQVTNPDGQLFRVVSSGGARRHLKLLRQWVADEWGDVDVFQGQTETFAAMPPLLAIDNSELLGGLIFSSFKKPDREELGLWINALFVAPGHRRKGIASQLVRAAAVEAARAGERELFALTDIPMLYQALGWMCVSASSEGTIVETQLER